jgi:hypothetical protein
MHAHQTTKIKPAERQFVYEQGKDLTSTLYNIVQDMREEVDQNMINDWSISPKQLKSCSAKVHGTGENPRVELRVSEMAGGYRVPAENPCVLSSRASDTVKLLDKFEKALKKEFKKRTGKALTIKKPQLRVDWQQVALNGLYQFIALRVGECTTKLQPQEWERK